MVSSHSAIAKNPRAVSFTKLKSRVGVKSPNLISFIPLAICVIMVGIIALADCLGPYVLKGRAVVTGNSGPLIYFCIFYFDICFTNRIV